MAFTIEQNGWQIIAKDEDGSILGVAKLDMIPKIPEVASHLNTDIKTRFQHSIQITDFEINKKLSPKQKTEIIYEMLSNITICARQKAHSHFLWFMATFDNSIVHVLSRHFTNLDRRFIWGREV